MLNTFVLLSLAAAPGQPRLAVLDLVPAGGVDAASAAAFTDTLTTELAARGHFEVISSADVRTLLGVERQRQLLGCEESSCMTELAGALGSRYVASGSLTQLGAVFQLSVQVIDTQTAKPLGRASQVAPTLADLRALIPWMVADATATERPVPPSKVLPIAMISVGGAGVIAGGIVGGLALSHEQALAADLGRPASETQPLDSPLASYQKRANDIGAQKSIALAAMISGAALAVVGVILFPRGPNPPPIALVPSDRGFAFVGVLP